GLESIARDPEGRIIAIPERSGAETRPFPVYRWDGRRWTIPYRLPRRGGFLPTSADFDDRGRLYLLERSFAIFSGFTTRIRRFSFDGDAITGEETLLESAPNAYDNAEGLSLWRTAEGDLRMTLISDDNFQFLQRTVVSEFAVQE
ncbi:MAG: esterase-like activity of phytase family protein, partial [Rubricella sp.]